MAERYRGTILPFKDVDGQLEWALPGMLYHPLQAMSDMGAMALGRKRMDPRRVTEGALDTAMLATPVGLLGGAPRGALGMFAGRNAATADKRALGKAMSMEGRGASRDDIWQETGWFKDVDGNWKFEIDDSGFSLNDVNLTPPAIRAEAAGETQDYIRREGLKDEKDWQIPGWLAFEHEPLKAAHDSVNDIAFTRRSHTLGEGSYDRHADNVNISMLAENPKSTALHELQHAVQTREGFAKGGSPSNSTDDIVSKLNDKMRENVRKRDYLVSLRFMDADTLKSYGYGSAAEIDGEIEALKVGYNNLMDMRSSANSETSRFDRYRRLAGEAEARNVQTRMDYTPEQRRATPPWETLDVPEDELVVRMGGDGASESQSIKKAAIVVDGKIYTGANHGEAVGEAATALGKSIDDVIDMGYIDGFTDDAGDFLTVTEALGVAKKAGQVNNRRTNHKALRSEDVDFSANPATAGILGMLKEIENQKKVSRAVNAPGPGILALRPGPGGV